MKFWLKIFNQNQSRFWSFAPLRNAQRKHAEWRSRKVNFCKTTWSNKSLAFDGYIAYKRLRNPTFGIRWMKRAFQWFIFFYIFCLNFSKINIGVQMLKVITFLIPVSESVSVLSIFSLICRKLKSFMKIYEPLSF